MNASELVAVFTPDATRTRWSLRLLARDRLANAPGEMIDGLERPDIARLGEQMLEAVAGCVIRTAPDGAVEISASERSAVVLHAWVLEEIARAR